ncbi:MAG: ABC transporter permease [Lachnospiraceae bacterium]|nr:ABC transporter permease [Lachnospiraceae bacterium]
MLVKMVCKNMDRKNMLLYALSIILSIVLDTFFLSALMVNEQYGLGEKAGSMDLLCTLFFLIAGAVSIFFTFYSTGYYVRTKNRDYSLLMMLGSSRKTIFKFYSVEFLLIYVFSVVSGIFVGGILSTLFLTVLRIWGYLVRFSLSDILRLIVTVIKASFLLFVVEYLVILIYFSKKDLSAIQLRSVRKEKRHETTCFLVVGGIGAFAYAMILLRRNDTLYEMLSIVVCLVGMYMILSYGGSLTLTILKMFQNFYYGNMIVLNEFYFKFISNCRLLYMMFVLDFAVLFFTGGCVISRIQEDVDSAEYPYGFVGVMQNSEQTEIEKYRELLGNDRIELSAIEGEINEQGYKETYLCISDRDYSQLTDHDIQLEETEAILVNESTILDLDKPECVLTIVEVRNEIVFGMEKPDCLREFIILPESVIAEYKGNEYTIIAKKGGLQKEYEQYKNCFQETNADIFWRCAFFADANENMTFVKIISVFAGLFCLISSFALFVLRVQGDLPLLRHKYGLLYQIGMSEKAIAKAVSAEYRNLLLIPLLLSILISGIYMFAETTGWNEGIWDYVCRYIPFQAAFLVLNSVLIYACLRKFRRVIVENVDR